MIELIRDTRTPEEMAESNRLMAELYAEDDAERLRRFARCNFTPRCYGCGRFIKRSMTKLSVDSVVGTCWSCYEPPDW